MSEPEYHYVRGQGWIVARGRTLTYADFVTPHPDVRGLYLYDQWICLHCNHTLVGKHASQSDGRLPMVCKDEYGDATTTEGLFVAPIG